MAFIRSKTSKNNKLQHEDMEFFSANDSDVSIPERNSRGAPNNIETANFQDLEKDHERIRYGQKVIEMNNQIRELTSIVKHVCKQNTTTVETIPKIIKT